MLLRIGLVAWLLTLAGGLVAAPMPDELNVGPTLGQGYVAYERFLGKPSRVETWGVDAGELRTYTKPVQSHCAVPRA